MAIKRLALFLRALAWLGAVLVLMRPALGWLGPPELFATIADGAFTRSMDQPGTGRFLLMALMLPPYLSIAWGLLQLAGFCTRLAYEQHFTHAAAGSLGRLGWSILASAVLLPVTRVLALAWVVDDAFGQLFQSALRLPTVISVTMGLIFGTIIIIFSRLLQKSVQLQEENSSFI